MSIIQQFHLLPENLQQEVLDFMSYIAEKNGIELVETDIDIFRCSKMVNKSTCL